MKKLLVLSSLLLLSGCKKEETIYTCNGIPDMNQAFSYMYFKSETEGYLFGTLTAYQELTEKELQDPDNIPESTDEANIYKTTNGGKNWVKIDSISDYSFYTNAYLDGKNSIFIKIIDSKENLKNNLVRFDIKSNKITRLNFNFERMGQIWSDNNKVFINSKNNDVNTIYLTTYNFKEIDSIKANKIFKENIISVKNNFYVLTWDNELYNISKKVTLQLPLIPANLVKQEESRILIAGNTLTDENEISLISYDVNTAQSKTLKKFKNYSVIENMQSNNRAIIGFIGNIKGAFTEYDLFYSLDKGKTWQIKKLEEPNYVRPSCLIDNIVYIYSGGARMQKIILE